MHVQRAGARGCRARDDIAGLGGGLIRSGGVESAVVAGQCDTRAGAVLVDPSAAIERKGRSAQ